MSDGDRTAFMEKIIREPDEDTHRLVFADWLEEHGEPERAEFIRVQIAGPVVAGTHPIDYPGRQKELWAAVSRDDARRGGWDGWIGNGVDHYRRGFLDSVRCPARVWLANADKLCWHPAQKCDCQGSLGSLNVTGCLRCGYTGRRPCPPTAHPIRRVVLTDRIGITTLRLSSTYVEFQFAGRPLRRIEMENPHVDLGTMALPLAVEWPGIAFELPAWDGQVLAATADGPQWVDPAAWELPPFDHSTLNTPTVT